MRCIFCLEEKPGTEEHVFPLAIGGSLVMYRVCVDCNSTLGSKIDTGLTNFDPILWKRGELGLAGNSGTPPSLANAIEGMGTLASDPERKVKIKYNKLTGKMDMTSIHHRREKRLEGGGKAIQIVVDHSNERELPKIIQRERKRHGVRPLTDVEMIEELGKLEVQEIQNPQIILNRKINFSLLRHSVLKIAYELAFMWLGEAYLDDPQAAFIRDGLMKPTPNSTDAIGGGIKFAPEESMFRAWEKHPTHHRAYGIVMGRQINIAVQIFDIVEGIFPVTHHAKNYVPDMMMINRLRFLVLDATTNARFESSFIKEAGRIGTLMMAGRRPPFPDPL